jgi:hypothetical protein
VLTQKHTVLNFLQTFLSSGLDSQAVDHKTDKAPFRFVLWCIGIDLVDEIRRLILELSIWDEDGIVAVPIAECLNGGGLPNKCIFLCFRTRVR